MDANSVGFSLIPISPKISSSGGYQGYLEGRPTYDFDRLLDETKLRHPSVDKKQLKTDVEHLFDTAATVAGDDLVNVQIGDYLLLRPYLNGRFDEKGSEYDPAIHSVVQRAICRRELKVDYAKWTFHNNTPGKKLKVESVNSANADDTKTIKRLRDICLNGANMNMILPEDYVEFACTSSDGTQVTGRLDVLHSDVKRITCRWPEALNASTVGGKVSFTVCGRCGDEDAKPQKVTLKKPVTILVGDEPDPEPPLTGDEPEVTRGYSSGYSDPGMIDPNADFIMEGCHLGGASVRIDWTDEGGNERNLTVPADEVKAEDETISLQQGDWLEACTTNDGAVLTFTVTTSHGSTTYQATVRA